MRQLNNKPARTSTALQRRVAIYVVVILFCSWLIGEHYGDKGLVIGVAVGIAVILAMFALAAHIIRRHMDWIRNHLGMLVGIFVVLQLLLILLTYFQKH